MFTIVIITTQNFSLREILCEHVWKKINKDNIVLKVKTRGQYLNYIV